MEITGRLTADAEVRKTTNNKELVAFTVAVNDYYKTKSGEQKEQTEYFSCSYWLSTKIADSLQKGCIVTVTGRVYLNEYDGKDGKHYSQLCCHADRIKIIAWAGKKEMATTAKTSATAVPVGATPETIDDLPF